MTKPKPNNLEEMAKILFKKRFAFKLKVQQTCKEVEILANSISDAIGEISIKEAEDFIVKEFVDRMKEKNDG